MSHSMQIVEVNGLNVLTTEVVLEHDCVSVKERGWGTQDVVVEIMWGLSSYMEKELKNNSNFLKNRDNLYVLFSEDERTYQGYKVLSAKHNLIQGTFSIEMTIAPVNETHQRIIDYLVRKKENQILEDSMERKLDKILGRDRE